MHSKVKLDAVLLERLAYLQPFADHLATLPPEETDESVDSEPLFALLEERRATVPDGDAAAVMAVDAEALDVWLRDRPFNVAHFILPFHEEWIPPSGDTAPREPLDITPAALPRPDIGDLPDRVPMTKTVRRICA